MKSILNRIAIALVITSLTSVMAFAKTKTEMVKFDSDIKVNGTVVSKGVYLMTWPASLQFQRTARSLPRQQQASLSAIRKRDSSNSDR